MTPRTLAGRVSLVQSVLTVAALAAVVVGTSFAVTGLLQRKRDAALGETARRAVELANALGPYAQDAEWMERELSELRPSEVRIEFQDPTGFALSKYTANAEEVRKMVPDLGRPLVVYCNGLYCGRSKRFSVELRKLGYTNLRRYQLGIPAWRALGGVTQVEKDAFLSLIRADGTAVLVDAREAAGARPRLKQARWIPPSEASKAKDDGRLPMTDHNTRILVVGDGPAEARGAAEAIVRDAFHNVSFFAGTAADLADLHEAG